MITEWFNAWHQWTFEQIVQPMLYRMEWMSYDELAYDWTHLFLLGGIEVLLLWALIRPLELWLPVERWADRKATRVDVVYMLLARLGVLPILFFVLLTPAFDSINAQIRLAGIIPPSFDNLLFYLVVLDFADYWRHRFEHRFQVWWALHSVHHSQRQMTFWTDEREHLLGQLIAAIWRAAVGLAVLRVMKAEKLPERAERMGQYLMDALRALQQRYECIGDVRGKGLLIGLEIVQDRESRKPDRALASRVQKLCLEAGLVLHAVRQENQSAIRLAPPLTVTQAEMDRGIEIMDQAFRQALEPAAA